MKVVIIDDEERIRNLIRKIIPWDRIGMTVVGEASNGYEGMELCTKLEPDIVFTDIRMPGMDGLALVENLRRNGCTAEFVLISGYDDFSYAQRAIKAGACDYVLKPIEEDELVKILENVKAKIKKNLNDQEYLKKLKKEIHKLQAGYSDLTADISGLESKSDNLLIQRALAYIEENYNCELSLDNIADKLFIHNTYFSELFKKEVGMGFNDYVTELRVEKAKMLLLNPNLKINEVADMVGYKNPSYFIRVFRKLVGDSPNEFKLNSVNSSTATQKRGAKA